VAEEIETSGKKAKNEDVGSNVTESELDREEVTRSSSERG
jgi:hypothetical protein